MKFQSNKLRSVICFVFLFSFSIVCIQAQDKSGESLIQSSDKSIKSYKDNSLTGNLKPEEIIIHWAYRKLTIAETMQKFADAGIHKKTPKEERTNLAKKTLQLKISDVKIGPIEEIQNLKYNDLVTPPTGEIIQIGRRYTSNNGDEEKFSINAKWVDGQYSSGFDSNWTIEDILQLDSKRFYDIGMYASYKVKVSLDGKKRTYNALVLFHNPFQSHTIESLKPEFLDIVIGMGGIITQVYYENKIPIGTSKKLTQKNPQVKNYPIEDETSRLSECVEINYFSPGECGSCIDGYITPIGPAYICTLWWYPTGGGIVGGYDPPDSCTASNSILDYPTEVDRDTREHAYGDHLGTTDFTSICEQRSGCQTDCRVNIDSSGYSESGATTNHLYYHVGGKNSTTRSNTGPKDTDVSCESATGYAFKNCLYSGCGVSLTVGIAGAGANASVTVTSEDSIWSTGHIKGRTCKNGK